MLVKRLAQILPAGAAAVALTAALTVGTPPAGASAGSLACPPGFETLPGCSTQTNDAGASSSSWVTESIAGMNVKLYVPATAPAVAGQRALMINLHGCVQTASTLATAGNWQAVVDAYGMVVAAPDAPNGGVLLGCWDYYDSNHSRTSPSRHDDNLLQLAQNLLGREDLNLDEDQVYISGLSSGGGETMVMGCLAPDVFAGVGINAGPTVGTTAGQIGYVATTKTAGVQTCRSFAGSTGAGFQTQLASIIYGDNDSTVAPGYNVLNAGVMAEIYGADSTSQFSLSGLAGTNTAGSGTLYSDAEGPRVSLIQNTGMGHNWPAGGGPGGSYVTTNSINYPAYITDFFFENNRRVAGGEPTVDAEDPTMQLVNPEDGAEVAGTVQLEATAADDTGVARVEFRAGGQLLGTDSSAPYSWSWDTSTLPNGSASVAATAVDQVGKSSSATATVVVSNDRDALYCGRAANAEHEAAGRAVSYGTNPYNPFYARGSQGYMGQGDSTATILKETSPGYFIVAAGCAG
ncbi:poly(3-hydroxybutyrate) depolymerase [Arthrobacter crystallopoietes BAB-32]|uniref:Poly(3-hydroxybutyrate) depolymerase n=1 Tax=Arthrobacter crystallopoietes BAB-32 TaxID=1246476 RepID=N1USL0_9MICC|nr:PHB depolymerase family esterase [Arthrobacter crystallopoietes]EMY33391.1 poly(3-hydroxybutyrate) depolymerase [Arthrobacter crystallopoietes BAB-32]